MREIVGKNADIGRLGGDEFVTVLNSPPTGRGLLELMTMLEERTSASVGAATSNESAQDARTLLEAADLDLYRHKARRKQRMALPPDPGRDTPVRADARSTPQRSSPAEQPRADATEHPLWQGAPAARGGAADAGPAPSRASGPSQNRGRSGS